MKTLLALVTALGVTSLVGCGDLSQENAAASSLKAGNDSFYISPLGSTASCLQNVPTSAGLIAQMGNCSGISPTRVRYMNGAAWDGRDGHVTISIQGQCMTNPASYDGSADPGYLTFTPCNDDGTVYGLRQMFGISRNANGAVQIYSPLQYTIGGVANPFRECIERPTPTTVRRQRCVGLNNWGLWQ